jgi:hypothetical protein
MMMDRKANEVKEGGLSVNSNTGWCAVINV